MLDVLVLIRQNIFTVNESMSFTVNACFSQALFHRTLQHAFKSLVYFLNENKIAGITISYDFSREK